MQLPQNSSLRATRLTRFQTWTSLRGFGPSISLLSASWGRRGTRPRRRPGPAPSPAPPPMGRPNGSSVTITEGHNQRGKFAEPYSLSGPAGARFFQLFWGKEEERMWVWVDPAEPSRVAQRFWLLKSFGSPNRTSVCRTSWRYSVEEVQVLLVVVSVPSLVLVQLIPEGSEPECEVLIQNMSVRVKALAPGPGSCRLDGQELVFVWKLGWNWASGFILMGSVSREAQRMIEGTMWGETTR